MITDPTTFTYFRGRVALYALLRGLGIREGDEVAISAYTCVAVPEGVLATGARPVFFDLEPGSLTMDPAQCESMLTSKVRAIIVQHTFGIPARMSCFLELAQRTGLTLIEDCCHTFSSTYAGREVGRFGDAAFYSFEWGKPVVAGLGGSLVCWNPDLEHQIRASYPEFEDPSRLRDLRLRGQYWAFSFLYRPSLFWRIRDLKNWLGRAKLVEGNYSGSYSGPASEDFRLRMAPSCRARLHRRLRSLDAVTEHSRWVSRQYRSGICSRAVQHLDVPAGAEVVYARYPLRTEHKEPLLALARAARVEIANWYATPVHPLERSQWESVGYRAGSCPNAERRAREIITLPTHPRVTHRDITRTIHFLNEVVL